MVTDWEIIKETFIKDGGNYSERPIIPMNVELRSNRGERVAVEPNDFQAVSMDSLKQLVHFGSLKDDLLFTFCGTSDWGRT